MVFVYALDLKSKHVIHRIFDMYLPTFQLLAIVSI